MTARVRLRHCITAAVAFALLAGSAVWADAEQGGFRLFDPGDPRGRDVGVLSLGPLVLAGARVRIHQPDGVPGLCNQAVFVMLGAEGTKRKAEGVAVKQKSDVVVFFVITQCVGEDEVCLEGASEAVAVEGCGGSVKLSTRSGVSGSAKVQCKNGISLSAPAFGLTPTEQQQLAEAFPDIGAGISIAFKDEAGEEVTGDDLAFKIQNLDVDALDDVVATYLADDALPLCP